MSNAIIPLYVNEALAHRILYYNSENFNIARALVAECHGTNGTNLDDMIKKFLTERNVLPNAELNDLLQMKEPDVRLFGDTHHFTRKFFTTTYGLPDNPNPILPISNVFNSLYVSGNEKSARFLRELAELSSQDPNNQKRILQITDDILPYAINKYKEAVGKVQTSRKKRTAAYESEIAAADNAHNMMLDKVIDFAREVIKYQRKPLLKPFMNFAGIRI